MYTIFLKFSKHCEGQGKQVEEGDSAYRPPVDHSGLLGCPRFKEKNLMSRMGKEFLKGHKIGQ